MEYFDEEALTCIGNRIGRTLKVDVNTSCQLRGHFARICVLVDLGKQLMSGFSLDGEDHYLEYEGLHMLCTKCGVYGHRQEGCQMKKAPNTGNEENMMEGESHKHGYDQNEDMGAPEQWKVVEKRRFRKSKEITGDQSGLVKQGSRFNVLTEMNQIKEANLDNAGLTREEAFMGFRKRERTVRARRVQDCAEEGQVVVAAKRQSRSELSTDGKEQRVDSSKRIEKRTRSDRRQASEKEAHVYLLTMGEEGVDPSANVRLMDREKGVGQSNTLKAQSPYPGPLDPGDHMMEDMGLETTEAGKEVDYPDSCDGVVLMESMESLVPETQL